MKILTSLAIDIEPLTTMNGYVPMTCLEDALRVALTTNGKVRLAVNIDGKETMFKVPVHRSGEDFKDWAWRVSEALKGFEHAKAKEFFAACEMDESTAFRCVEFVRAFSTVATHQKHF